MPSPFKGYRIVTQLYPLPPTIFNLVMDAFIQHWVMVVVEIEAGTEGLGSLVQYLVAYLYADNILVASTQTERFQRSFDLLMDIFDWLYECTKDS